MRTYSKTSFDKSELFKALKLENANFAHFVSHPLDGNVPKDLFWQNWTPSRLETLEARKAKKGKLCSFCKPPAWWKSTQRNVLTKVWTFKSLEARKAQKGKLCSFCKRLLGEKVLKDMLLKALKLKNPQKSKLCSFCKPLTWWKEVCRSKKAKFTHFVSRPFDLFWQRRKLLKALKLEKFENANFIHFVSHRCGEKVHRVFF